jgi:hypothetical protein
MSEYKWRSTYRASVPADVAAAELGRIKADHGFLTAPLLVDEARGEESPLHPAFEWNDDVAAENYRRNQASTLIRALVVIDAPAEPPRKKYVLVSSAETESRTTYEDSAVVVADVDLFADALARLEAEVQSARRSVVELERLAAAKGVEPERMARIALATKALEAASAAVAALH